MPPVPFVSRYGITQEDLKQASRNLQVGGGRGDVFTDSNALKFVAEAEDWADAEVSDRFGVPLQPIPAFGDSTVSSPVTPRNYPREFIQAILYEALSRLNLSQYFENDPNKSAAAEAFAVYARDTIERFKQRTSSPVGGGRKRHSNPFMPPNIAPPPAEDPRVRNPYT